MKENKVYLGTIIIVISFLLIYFFIADIAGLLDPVIFPPLFKILAVFIDSLPELIFSIFSSLKLLIPSYLSAAFIGITLGLIIGLNPKLTKTFRPIIFALNPIPPSMLTPYMIAIMPTFYFASVGIIFIACFWPFLNGTLNGIYVIDQKYFDNAKILELTGIKRIRYVILPAAAPSILAGAGTALNLSFIMLAIAEMFAVDSGIGHFIQYYADFSDYARVISGIIFLGIFTVLVMLTYQQIKKKILFWALNENK